MGCPAQQGPSTTLVQPTTTVPTAVVQGLTALLMALRTMLRTMMGGCYQAPLNAQVNGGTMVWQGTGTWTPRDICVDWMSDNFAWQCTTTPVGASGKSWDLVDCHDLTPFTKCSDLTM